VKNQSVAKIFTFSPETTKAFLCYKQLIVFFQPYHSSNALKILCNMPQKTQFLHRPLKSCELLPNLPHKLLIPAHRLHLHASAVEGLHRLLANHTAVSVIEEKGEGFEKRKNNSRLIVVSPSTLALQCCIVRLKIYFSYKSVTEHLKQSNAKVDYPIARMPSRIFFSAMSSCLESQLFKSEAGLGSSPL